MKTPETISSADLAKLSGYSERYLRNLAAAGLFPPAKLGQYQRDAALQGLLRHLRAKVDSERKGLARARANFISARVKRLTFDLEVEQGKHVPLSEIGPALKNVSANQRAELQRRLEVDLPPAIVGRDLTFVRQKCADTVDEICRIFQENTLRWMESPPPETPKPLQ